MRSVSSSRAGPHRKLGKKLPAGAARLRAGPARRSASPSPGHHARRTRRDKELQSAIKILSKLRKASADPQLRPSCGSLQAEAMAAIKGSSPSKTRYAAAKAGLGDQQDPARLPAPPPASASSGSSAGRRWPAAGKVKEAAAELRNISIERAGEPESELAWQELEAPRRRAQERQGLGGSPPRRSCRRRWPGAAPSTSSSRGEILGRGPSTTRRTPRYLRSQAKSSRGVHGVQAARLQDLRPTTCCPATKRHRQTSSCANRVLRCMEARRDVRGTRSRSTTGGSRTRSARALKAAIVWEAFPPRVQGAGCMSAPRSTSSSTSRCRPRIARRRTWMKGWLAMRLGPQRRGHHVLRQSRQRYSSDRRKAQYFQGKLLVATGDPTRMEEGPPGP